MKNVNFGSLCTGCLSEAEEDGMLGHGLGSGLECQIRVVGHTVN